MGSSRLAEVLEDAGGVDAPRERAAQIRAELLDALHTGAQELQRTRAGYPEPVQVAIGAQADRLIAIAPIDPGLRADAAVATARAWDLVATLVGALVDGATAMEAAAPEDLVLSAGAWEGWLALAFPLSPAAGDDPHDAVELAIESFSENVAEVDRLRAEAQPTPITVIGEIDDLRAPIGVLHPLRIAEAVGRFGGHPADAGSIAEHEEAVLAVLDPVHEVARPHEDAIPSRRVARRILQRLMGMGKWGGYHTEIDHLARGFAGHDRALALEVGERLLDAGLLQEKPSVGQRHVFLNPRRAGEIHAFVERGEVPKDLDLP